MADLIAEGDNIILEVNGKLAFIRVKSGSKVRIGTEDCSASAFVGVPFGTAFLLDEDKQLAVTATNPLDEIETATGTERVRTQYKMCVVECPSIYSRTAERAQQSKVA